MKLLVTGGAGFIGSHFIRLMMGRRDVRFLINLDKLTYAGHLDNLREFTKDKRYRFVRGDIANPVLVQRLIKGVDAVVNFAAETHVDRSIRDAAPFLHSNVIGVQVLLEAARKAKVRRFMQISTDEIYNIGTGRGLTNISVARTLLKRLQKPQSLIRRVPDRLGHDRRYAMSVAKIKRELGWKPSIGFEEGLLDTITWYEAHRSWWETRMV